MTVTLFPERTGPSRERRKIAQLLREVADAIEADAVLELVEITVIEGGFAWIVEATASGWQALSQAPSDGSGDHTGKMPSNPLMLPALKPSDERGA